MAIRSLCLAGVLLALTGCKVGTISTFDGDWPLRPLPVVLPTEHARGPAGDALVRGGSWPLDGDAVLLADGEAHSLDRLAGAGDPQPLGRTLYSRLGEQIQARRLPRNGGAVGPPQPVCTVAGLRLYRPLPDGRLLAANDAGVLLIEGDRQRSIWRGEAEAVAWDATREAAWIVARAPLATIDCVRVDDGELLLRSPLPVELDSPNVEVLLSGGDAVVYAHDRPLAAGLLISPDALAITTLGRALPSAGLGADPWPEHGGAPPLTRVALAEGEWPPVLTPPGRFDGERLRLFQATGPARGRVAPFPGGRFLVLGGWELEPWTVGVSRPRGSGAPPSLVAGALPVPDGWIEAVSAVSWDPAGVTLVCADRSGRGPDLVRLEPKDVSRDRVGGWRSALRRGFNYVFNACLVPFEVALALPANAVISGAVSALTLPAWAICMTADAEDTIENTPTFLGALTMPVWGPITLTLFGADPLF